MQSAGEISVHWTMQHYCITKVIFLEYSESRTNFYGIATFYFSILTFFLPFLIYISQCSFLTTRIFQKVAMILPSLPILVKLVHYGTNIHMAKNKGLVYYKIYHKMYLKLARKYISNLKKPLGKCKNIYKNK